MKKHSLLTSLLIATVMIFTIADKASAQATKVKINATLQTHLEGIYLKWRSSMVEKNYNLWAQYTAAHKQITIRNRILSEKKPYPASVFNVPALPPTLKGLKALRVESKGTTAKMVYFGKVDFGVGGKPTDNILMLSFLHENGQWRYSNVDFFNLNLLKDKRAELKRGNLKFVEEAGFGPSGVPPVRAIQIRKAVPYIAKVYVFCPGKEVKLKVNRISDHRFQHNQISEVVIGGAVNGRNEISYAIKDLKGSNNKEALTIRVYLMSTVKGVKPLKVYEYQVKAGEKPKPFGTGAFVVGPKEAKHLLGR